MTNTASRIVVVGASLGGVRTAEALRAAGFTGPLSLIGEESRLPYDRPPLSKQFLGGAWDEERIALRPGGFESLDLDLRLGVRVSGLDLYRRELSTSTGRLPFDGLVIATGARPRRLAVRLDHRAHHVVRTQGDSERLRAALLPGARVIVIGAGFIGAEVAATAHGLGCEVTILEAAPLPLERQLGAEMAAICAGLHASNGVTLHTGVTITETGEHIVVLEDGRRFEADVVVVGVGVQPNMEWLEGSGLTLGNGVECDAACRAAPGVVAVGDVACWPNERYSERARIEHWTNAVEMASHAADTLLADLDGEPGRATPFAPVPYFWSDQYKTKIQFLGRSTGHEEVRMVAGDKESAKLLALYRKGDRLIGALGLTMARHLMRYRALLLEGASWEAAIAAAPT